MSERRSASEPLAIHGGPRAVRSQLPPMRPGARQLGEAEERAASAALRKGTLDRYEASPSLVSELERAFAARIGVPHALAVNSGTSALECALVGLGVGPGDEVIVPAYTWIAVPNAVVALGAVPVPVDIDASLTLDPAAVSSRVGPRTRGLIAVHMRGAPCHMTELADVARQAGLFVLEDVAQAPGGSFGGRPLGSLGDAAAFSFQSYKLVTSGEGGLCLAKERDVFLRAAAHHDFDSPHQFGVSEADWFEVAIPGRSLRMHELTAAVLGVQLARLDDTVARSRRAHARVKDAVSVVVEERGCAFRAVVDAAGEIGIALVLLLPDPARALAVAEALRAEGVDGACTLYSTDAIDYHVHAYWAGILARRFPERADEFAAERCPRTLHWLGRAVHLDVSPELADEVVDEIALAIEKVLRVLA